MLGAGQNIEPQAAEHPVFAKLRQDLRPQVTTEDGVAIVPISGVLMRRPHPFEMIAFDAEDSAVIEEEVTAAALNPEAKAILLDIDSPGGYSVGIAEIGQAVRLATNKKPVVAFTGGLMASAAYWIGSQATEIVATRSARVGSIGVYAAYYDYSARLAAMGIKLEVFTNKEGTYKAAGLGGSQLTEQQRDLIQAQVQEDFDEFKATVLKARPGIPAEAMQGQTFSGRKANSNNLVDHTGTRRFALLRAKRLAAKS
jgi:signal peptide peptidase SppA